MDNLQVYLCNLFCIGFGGLGETFYYRNFFNYSRKCRYPSMVINAVFSIIPHPSHQTTRLPAYSFNPLPRSYKRYIIKLLLDIESDVSPLHVHFDSVNDNITTGFSIAYHYAIRKRSLDMLPINYLSREIIVLI